MKLLSITKIIMDHNEESACDLCKGTGRLAVSEQVEPGQFADMGDTSPCPECNIQDDDDR